ncbi:MAG TPA: retroviral-like aspartic protease family protein [Allosphingosinicella sp.]|jgi:predicted aspartyl protease|nr:retroviral-like aspartic protease family protein [Allosphingosinicella sp.]
MKHPFLLLPAALLLGAAPPAAPPSQPTLPAAADPAQAPAPDGDAVDLGKDGYQRMTVPVNIGGLGPYKFIVDTGAERTVIARQLADNLKLDANGTAHLYSMSEVSDVDTVLIPSLEVGGKRYLGIKAPALDQRNLGAQGMLGVDALQAQRVSFDFPHHAMTVVASHREEEHWDGQSIIVTARSRFGHLVLVDASVEGQKVWVIVDTGAQTSVGNTALRHALERHHKLPETTPLTMVSVTGGRVVADATTIRRIRLGEAYIQDMPIAFADVAPFKKLDLLNRPALLLGMDALKLFDRVSVDFANRRVRLMAPGHSLGEVGIRLAAR